MNTLIILLTGLMAGLLNKPNRNAAYIFCIAVLLFNWFDKLIPNEYGAWGYILAALVDLALIFVMKNSIVITRYIVRLSEACAAFIVVNFIGWAFFMNYAEPTIYASLCSLVYGWILVLTTWKGISNYVGYNLGGDSVDGRDISLYRNDNTSRQSVQINKKETKF